MNIIKNNAMPLSLVLASTCIGYLTGNTANGMVVGLLLVSLATLFSQCEI